LAYTILIADYDYFLTSKIKDIIRSTDNAFEIVGTVNNGAIVTEQFFLMQPNIIILGQLPYLSVQNIIDGISDAAFTFSIILISENKSEMQFKDSPIDAVIDRNLSDTNKFLRILYHVREKTAKKNKEIEKIKIQQIDNYLYRNDILNKLAYNQDGMTLKSAKNDLDLDIKLKSLTLLMAKTVNNIKIQVDSIIRIYTQIKQYLNLYKGGEVFITHDGMICIIVNDLSSEYFPIAQKAYGEIYRNIEVLIEKEYNTQFYFYLSKNLEKTNSIFELFHSANELVRFTYFNSDKKLLDWEEVVGRTRAEPPDKISEIAEKILVASLHGEIETVTILIEGLYYQELKPLMDFEAVFYSRNKIEEILTLLSHIFNKEIDINIKSLFDEENCITIEIEANNVQKVFSDLLLNIKDKYIAPNPSIVRIIMMLLNNYHDDLSLEYIARKMNMSNAYLSRFFKSQTGVNLIAYLNNIRINKAKELMLLQSLSIQDVSRRVGFRDSKYFGRIFKAVVGMKPSQYKKHVLEKRKIPYRDWRDKT